MKLLSPKHYTTVFSFFNELYEEAAQIKLKGKEAAQRYYQKEGLKMKSFDDGLKKFSKYGKEKYEKAYSLTQKAAELNYEIAKNLAEVKNESVSNIFWDKVDPLMSSIVKGSLTKKKVRETLVTDGYPMLKAFDLATQIDSMIRLNCEQERLVNEINQGYIKDYEGFINKNVDEIVAKKLQSFNNTLVDSLGSNQLSLYKVDVTQAGKILVTLSMPTHTMQAKILWKSIINSLGQTGFEDCRLLTDPLELVQAIQFRIGNSNN